MRWMLVLAAALSLTALTRVGAQEPITANVTLEPARVTVGDRLTLIISVQHAAGLVLEAPDEPEAFEPLDLVEAGPPVVQDLGGGRQETRFRYELAAFQTGELELGSLNVTEVDAAPPLVAVRPAPILVDSVVPPDGPLQFRDLKAPLQASTGPPTWIWGALIMAAFTALSLFTMALARIPALRSPPRLGPEAPAPALPANEQARRELDGIVADGLLDRDEVTEFYGRIGDCTRAYLARRYDIPATAMTPAELEGRLVATGMDRLAVRQAVSTLEQCQAVQFAGYVPARERAEADLSAAYEILRLTTPAEGPPAAGQDDAGE